MKTTSPTQHNAIAACSFELQGSGDRIQLFPAGKFRAVDGRPTDCASWFIDAGIAQSIISALSGRTNPVVIDYEHQTLRTEQNGQPAPAAGWLQPSKLVWEDGGLFAEGVEWTSRARDLISRHEYRFISPVFSYNRQTGAVEKFIHAALTNDPGLDGMNAVTLAAATRLAALTSMENPTVNEELLKLLRQLLGLADDADEAAIQAALEKMVADLKPVTDAEGTAASLSAVLALLGTKDTEIAALKVAAAAKSGKPDPAKFVPVETVTEMSQQIAELTQRVNGSELDTVVTEALKAGKLIPAMEPWARDLGKKDLSALKSYVDAAAPIAALTSLQTGGKQPGPGNSHGLTAIELEVAALSNMSAEEFAAAKKDMEKTQ